LADLQTIANRITLFYRSYGYFVARAYVPAQDVRGGVVTITILEGEYGKVDIHNDAGISPSLIGSLLGDVRPGQAVTSDALERGLLLLSDVPGVIPRSTLKAGTEIGTSDLALDLQSKAFVSGSLDADNAGSPYTGTYRAGLTLNANNPTGSGDLLSLRTFGSTDSGLSQSQFSYQRYLGPYNTGISYSSMHYHLGGIFSPLAANGTADIFSLYATYPFLRSRTANLYLQTNLDQKRFEDHQDWAGIDNTKLERVFSFGISGDARGVVYGHEEILNYKITASTGLLELSPAAAQADTVAGKTNGKYSKLTFDESWIHGLGQRSSLRTHLMGQWASKNLDTSEQMELGGSNAVRAYPEGEAYGAQGYVVSVEWNWLMPTARPLPDTQLVIFADHGQVFLEKTTWAVGQDNTRKLSSAGIGFNCVSGNNWSLKTYWAHKVGDAVSLSSPDSPSRAWVQLVTFF
jgi:hemolysin activation/secretion protein